MVLLVRTSDSLFRHLVCHYVIGSLSSPNTWYINACGTGPYLFRVRQQGGRVYLLTLKTIKHGIYGKIIIIITNSQTSRAARSLNSVVTSRGVPAYCILLSIPRDHGTSTRVFRWRLCHEGLCVCLYWISIVE